MHGFDLSLALCFGANLPPNSHEVATHDLANFSFAVTMREERLGNRLKVCILAKS